LAWKIWSNSIGPNWLIAPSTGQTKSGLRERAHALAQRAG
jgi:hypothetical protein